MQHCYGQLPSRGLTKRAISLPKNDCLRYIGPHALSGRPLFPFAVFDLPLARQLLQDIHEKHILRFTRHTANTQTARASCKLREGICRVHRARLCGTRGLMYRLGSHRTRLVRIKRETRLDELLQRLDTTTQLLRNV